MPKGTSQAEVKLNSEKIKPVALAVIELRLLEGVSQLVRQSVSRKFFIIYIFLNSVKGFRVNLKACLCLTNTALSSSGIVETGFWVMFFVGHAYSFVVSTIQYYDNNSGPKT